MNELYQDYLRYLDLCSRVNFAMRVFHKIITDEIMSPDAYLQSLVDDVFTDQEREVWGKWSPGGTATTEEWQSILSASS